MKKIFCIFIMFCICIVNAWAGGGSQCPEQTQTNINEWQALCAREEGDEAEKLNKCIEYFYDNCGYLKDANTDTAVASVSEGGCEAFVGKNFDQIVEYLEKQVKANCAATKKECEYKNTIEFWENQCANKPDMLSKVAEFETKCNEHGAGSTIVNITAGTTLKDLYDKLSAEVEDNCSPLDSDCKDPTAKELIAKYRTDCKGKSDNSFKEMVDKYEDWCANGFADKHITDEPYKNYLQNDFVTKISDEIDKKCGAAPEDKNKKVSVTVDYATITGYGSTLDGIIGNLDLSVWKNADGKFNTARLASDSIAGVVLGTAGGLITSSVMKKHQAADGFEDLKCVVGGQSVAGWGDVFRVGIQ